MTGFELQISGIGSDRSTNCSTTTARHCTVTLADLSELLPRAAIENAHNAVNLKKYFQDANKIYFNNI